VDLISAFDPWHPARERSEYENTNDEDDDADEMRRSYPASEVIFRIVPSEEFDKGANESVPDQIKSKNLPVKFLAAV
jgi:hypothetical protein